MYIMQFKPIIDIIAFDIRLLDLFKTVFPYRNKLNRHNMRPYHGHGKGSFYHALSR